MAFASRVSLCVISSSPFLYVEVTSLRSGLDYPYVLALMRNKTIEVHNVETQNIVQVVSPATSTAPASPSSSPQRSSSSPKPTVLEPRRANICPAGFVVPASQGTDSLRLVSVTLSPSLVDDGEEKVSKFTLPPSDSLLSSSTQLESRQALNLPRARAIVISSTVAEPGRKATWALQALLPATLVSQAEALLPPQAQRIEEAIELAESAQRRMLGTGEKSVLVRRFVWLCLVISLTTSIFIHIELGNSICLPTSWVATIH